MQKPYALQPGDRVAAVSLSWGGPGAIPGRYEAGKQQLQQEFDLTVVEMPNTLRDPAWVQQNPRARAEDLMQAFEDPTIKGVISCIGGDDSIRILPYLDLRVLAEHPKVFVGYSDTTVTHFALFKAGVVSFYGPAVMSGFAENCGMHRYLAESFRRLVIDGESNLELRPNPEGWTEERLDWADPELQKIKRKLTPSEGWQWLQGEGVVEGHLLGGCVEVLDWLRASPVWPEAEKWRGAVLFIETSEEGISPEAVKRFLRCLGAAGVLERVSGLLVGRPAGTKNPALFPKYDAAILEVVSGELGLKSLPVISQMDFGHTDPFMTLPLGIGCRIDCQAKKINLTEPAVIRCA